MYVGVSACVSTYVYKHLCIHYIYVLCCAKSLHSPTTFCEPMDHSPPRSSAHENSPGKNTAVGYHFLLQGNIYRYIHNISIFIIISLSIYTHIYYIIHLKLGFPGGASGKEYACQCRRCKRHGFHCWARKIPWRRIW